jgi:CheY-like chemotaxis protein
MTTGTPTALILEDSQTQAQIIAKMIEHFGWTTIRCDNIREALDSLKLLSIQALFLDVFVGQHNTLLHFGQFRALAKSTPIVLMTAGSGREAIDKTLRDARRIGADHVLRKPFTAPMLQDIFASFEVGKDGRRPPHVLIIDDSSTVRRFAREPLIHQGYRVSEAATMEDAFANIDIAHVDLVLCDVFMPGMGGLKGMRTIKDTWPKVKILSMSAGVDGRVSETEALDATRRIGVDAQITKPFAPEDLVEVSALLLGRAA